MALLLGPRPLPQVVLSRDLGANAIREARAGGLVRVSHGAFVEPLTDGSSWEADAHLAQARVRAAAHRLTSTAVFSHESAALIHGLWLLRVPETVHVLQDRTPRRQTPGLRRHTGALAQDDVVEVHGLPVTSLERTVADCAKAMDPRAALVVADSAVRLVLEPHRDRRQSAAQRTRTLRLQLSEAVERGPRRGRRQARVVVDHAEPFAESPYETVIRWVALSRGLPTPVLQARFEVRGRTYYTDLCWSFELEGGTFRLRLIGEYDGELKCVGSDTAADAAHDAVRTVVEEKQREDDLRSMPDTLVVRFDRRDVNQTDAAFRRLCAALPASYVAGLRLVPGLAGLAAPRRRSS